MGTGAADGIPRIRCKCDHCQEARNIATQIEEGSLFGKEALLKRRIIRKRSSVLIKSGDLTLLLDTPPEIHRFLDEYSINNISAIFLSHKHFDHIWGFREFEVWDSILNLYAGSGVIPIVKGFVGLRRDEESEQFFFYKLQSRKTIDLGGIKITPFKVRHKVPTLGFLFEENGKKLMHLSDSSWDLNKWHIEKMGEADVVVVHTTTFDKLLSDHMSVKDVIELTRRYNFKKIILSHMNHNNLPHDKLVKELADFPNIMVAHDGLRVSI
jgi:phosphoribosyl 1,2-cyclic phosphate phosphodiesterase